MSATNLTKNLKLPQFVASDKPSWLGDINGSMLKIDDGYGKMAGDISKANDTASSAKSQSDANTQTLTNVNSELEQYGNRITSLEAGGGTEQLEQRVNTLSTDVESLQTRADTFEEEIAENGKSINTLKGKVDALEPKVKANADNITSLQTVTSGLTESVQENSGKIETLTNTVETQGKRLTTTEKTASNAFNKSQENSISIGNLTNEISSKSSMVSATGSLIATSSGYYVSNAFFTYDGNTQINFVFGLAILGTQVPSTKVNFAKLNVSGIITEFPFKTFVFNEVTVPTTNGNVIIGAEKEEGGENVVFNIRRATTGSALTSIITVISNGIIY